MNLLSDPWLPCLFAGETQTRDVSLREALARAPDIQRLDDSSPLVTVALHRLLLAVLHRVFGPKSEDEWADLWAAGRFDEARLDAYFETWQGRFELFDSEHPFYQTPGLVAQPTSAAKLGLEFSSGNNPMLFDHSLDAQPAALSAAAAARLVVANQTFALGGLLTRLKGDPPSAEATHLVKAAVLLVTGNTLFETLMFNLVKVNGDEGEPFEFNDDEDAPAWEQDPPRPEARRPRGYLDLLTWQARRILLFPDQDGEIRQVLVMAGYRFPGDVLLADRETMVAYTTRDKPAANQDPRPPVGFRPEKALWRDSLALLEGNRPESSRPTTVSFLSSLQRMGYLDANAALTLSAFGLSSDRAKVFLWRTEEMPLPAAYLTNEDLLTPLAHGLTAAEQAGRDVRRAVRSLASRVLAPDGNADPDRVSQLADALAPERAYWPQLDLPFRWFIQDLPRQWTTEERYGERAQADWAKAIQRAAVDSFEQSARAIETSGRGYRAAAETRSRFGATLAKTLAPLREQPQTQPEEVNV